VERILGDELSVESVGEGPAALIFLHGGCGGKSDWAAQVRHFGAAFRVVCLDLPGHGASSTPAQSTIEHLAASVVEVKKRHGLARNILVGHSMGCWVALEAYRQSPRGVAGLILIECSRLARDRAQRDAVVGQVRVVGGKTLLRRSYANMFLPDTDPNEIAFYLARVGAVSEDFIEGLILSTAEWDSILMAPTLESLQVPLLILQSTAVDGEFRRRSLARPEDSEWVSFARACAPDVEVEVIAEAGHFPHIDQPSVVNTAIERFALRLVGR
jgi:pimeloyl-ACP methyl ester carboxylesterase